MMSNPLVTPPREQVEHGVACITATDFRWLKCDVKSVSLLGNCLLKQMAVEAGAAEVVMFRDGCLTEAAASNVFIAIVAGYPDSALDTPALFTANVFDTVYSLVSLVVGSLLFYGWFFLRRAP